MRKLYEVHLWYYVLAEDETDADRLPNDFDMQACTREIHEANNIDEEWWDALPYSTGVEEEEKTCGEIFEEQQQRSSQ